MQRVKIGQVKPASPGTIRFVDKEGGVYETAAASSGDRRKRRSRKRKSRKGHRRSRHSRR